MGGLPRRASLIGKLQSDADGFRIPLDSGGTFIKNMDEVEKNSPLIEMKAGVMVEVLNLLGYELYNVGTMDLALGRKLIKDLMAGSDFPWISSNLQLSDGGYLARRYLVKDYGSVRVGFFGLLSPKAPLKAMGREGEFRIQEPGEVAREMVELLQGKGCRLVVLLSSLGFNQEAALASKVSGISVILGGYSRSMMRQPKILNQTMIVQAGSKGMYLGHLRLEIEGADPPGRWTRLGRPAGQKQSASRAYQWKVHSLSKSIADDQETAALLTRYKNRLREENMAEKVAARISPEAQAPQSAYVGVNVCSTCHLDIFREWATSSHGQAFAILESKQQEYNPECIPCHTTGYGAPSGFSSPRLTPHLQGVQCESCHGAGNRHRQSGSIIAVPGEEICLVCHNPENSPSFEFKTYLERLGGHALSEGGRAGVK